MAVDSLRPGRVQRFRSLVDLSAGPWACWPWKGKVDRYGYGRFHFDGEMRGAHRFAVAIARGPIPAGLEVDHVCRNRLCVNPLHLAVVTHLENLRRANAHRPPATWPHATATHCANGHEWTSENTRVSSRGRRYCMTCRANRAVARIAKTHCKRGHEFTPENTRIIGSTGRRRCRTCELDWRENVRRPRRAA